MGRCVLSAVLQFTARICGPGEPVLTRVQEALPLPLPLPLPLQQGAGAPPGGSPPDLHRHRVMPLHRHGVTATRPGP